jgi:hypothetical protein
MRRNIIKKQEKVSLDFFFEGFKTSYLAIYKRDVQYSSKVMGIFLLTDHERPLAISGAWRFR